MNDDISKRSGHLDRVAEIVAAYVARNQTAPDAVPDVIRTVHAALAEASRQDGIATQHKRPQPTRHLRLVHSAP